MCARVTMASARAFLQTIDYSKNNMYLFPGYKKPAVWQGGKAARRSGASTKPPVPMVEREQKPATAPTHFRQVSVHGTRCKTARPCCAYACMHSHASTPLESMGAPARAPMQADSGRHSLCVRLGLSGAVATVW